MAPAALAALPILIVFVGMLGLRWSAAGAGLAGLVAAGAIVISGMGPLRVDAPGIALLMTGSFAEALFTAATILWIIFPALCIYELQTRTGAFDAIRTAIGEVTDDRRLLVLLIAWFFGLFLEGAAGFGTPVALAAPLLVGLGVDPIRAVALTLIGHAAGVSFGAVGTPIGPQLAATMLPAIELSRATALFHVALGWILLAFLVKLADRTPPRKQDWLWAIAAGACFMTPYLLLASMIGPELPTLGGALVGSLLFLALVRRARGENSNGRSCDRREIVKAIAPYLALLVMVLATRLISGLRDALISVSWSWSLGDIFSGGFQPLYHPGTILLVAFLVGSAVQRMT
jgi:lactate permease